MRITPKLLRRLSPDVLQRALVKRDKILKTERLAARRQKLMTALAVIEKEMSRLDGAAPTVRRGPCRPRKTSEPVPVKRRRFSVATRKKMAASQRARWAKLREKEKAAAATG